ncbi:hypothetical protein SIN8267_01623 [Sinobacterium norvegicum]|uniref:ApeI dehydratase-like domain-containing protein n=1 Tax=Sinobacterium norvegicum TaxID=1641715 RepID=A0ABM9AFJ4_9GAMM|nr:hypothetical protein [Sinobacterium norvegicum]CAH0991517.1 hypothetical protein SIN8267_01623 [Sinobacterium norvegicum]
MNNPYPQIVATTVDGDSAELRLYIDQDIACVAGHFPDVAVVPGVAQIDWAIRLAADYLAVVGRFNAMDVVKFQQLLQPGRHCVLKLVWLPHKRQLQFRYSFEDAVYSSGRISLAAL